MQLEGQVAFITGGGSGIGRAAALELAKAGAKVAVLADKSGEIEAVAQTIQTEGSEALAIVGDVSQPLDMQKAVRQVVAKWGRLDIVFANAGINGVWTTLEELRPEDWDKTLNINLKGTFLTVKYAVPYLKKQGGSVVITASVNGTRIFSNTGATAYATSKAGQVAFTKMIALELAKDKVRVNVICPGAIETEINDNTKKQNVEKVKEPVEYPHGEIPLTRGKPGSAEQVAQLVLFLASPASSHISGSEIWIDGAESLLVG
jgi:NAD(P)-dependent dehydrogenase (short-subunit alcohol dehydrogenase family)